MAEPIDTTDLVVPTQAYLDVSRLGDGRYCVAVVRGGVASRKSYTAQPEAVMQQAQRAGGLAIHTMDSELRELCERAFVPLI